MTKTMHVFSLCMITEIISLGVFCNGRFINYTESDDYKDVLNSLFGIFGINGKLSKRNNMPSPPQHMLDLYQVYSDNSVGEQNMKYNNANIIRSFSNKGEFADKWYYNFDLKDTIPKYEEIVGAEFRFFIDRNELMLPEDSDVIKIQLFEGQENETLKLLEERLLVANSSGWEEFSVKSSVEDWCDNSELNTGFSVQILDSIGQEISNQRPPALNKDKEPSLTVYSRNSKITKSTTLLNKDFESFEAMPKYKSSERQRNSHQENSRNIRAVPEPKIDLCQRYEFKIDFGEIGWFNWILAPASYNAYTCKGACAYGENQNTTTHARMQSLVHHLGITDGLETPCCVPTVLKPLGLLFYDKDFNTVYAKFDDMVATECGCR